MIDFHMHSLLSDGALIPSELVRRAEVKGYRALAITDHADESNLGDIIERITKVSRELNRVSNVTVIPGIELTHIPPAQIAGLVKKARKLGAKVVVGHGETLAEPVAQGTNNAYIKAKVDILAHPGLLSPEDCGLAAKNRVFLEITSRGGHSLSNGHVASLARKYKAKMLVNTDSHCPGDLIDIETAKKVALGAGLTINEFKEIRENAIGFLEKIV